MKKHIQFLTIALIGSLPLQAQTTERIQINAGNFVVPQKEPVNMFIHPFIRNIGISYAHKINSRMGIRLQYNQWFQVLNIGADGGRYGGLTDGYLEPFKQPEDRRPGDIESHYSYRSADLAATYQLLRSKRHELYAGAGISCTWGWDSYYAGGIYIDSRKHQDIGLLAEAGYNYMIFKNRINIGVSETVKGYTTLPFQFYTNINVGYNFNWGFKKSAHARS